MIWTVQNTPRERVLSGDSDVSESKKKLSLPTPFGKTNVKIEFRPITAVALLFVVLLVVSAGSAGTAELADESADNDDQNKVVLEDETVLWPYTSRAESYDRKTLAINLVVYGDAAKTEQLLRQQAEGDWQEIDEGEEDIAPAEEIDATVNGTSIDWGTADGATRYVYVQPPGEEGKWIDESYQLRDGDYLGERHHVRAYVDPSDEEWTAMQAHREHWDWFHLRHTVHSVEDSQLYVEEEFVDHPRVESLHRERFANEDRSDADGWVTIIELEGGPLAALVAALLVGSFGAARLGGRQEWVAELREDDDVQQTIRAVALILALVALYATVRFGAVWAERAFPGVSPKTIAAVFYPLLVVGMPVCAYLAARQLETIPAFAAASIGFIVALFLDYTYLGVTALPMDTFVHRVALAAAIGFVAAGSSRTARRPEFEFGHVRTGVLLWVVGVSLPLLQFL